jgi:glycosyltransferase involved in cell wall biosynthesis
MSVNNIQKIFFRVCDLFCGNHFDQRTFEDYYNHLQLYPVKGTYFEDILDYLARNQVPSAIQKVYKNILGRRCETYEVELFCNRFVNQEFSLVELEKNLRGSSEAKLFKERLDTILSYAERARPISKYDHCRSSEKLKGRRIKAIVPVGKSGFSHSGKYYFHALYAAGASLTFQLHSIHGSIEGCDTLRDQILLAHLDNPIDYDTVIIMSSPNEWEPFILEERKKNPSVKVYGNTFWECDKVHPKWSYFFNLTDGIIAACELNKKTFELATTKPVHLVHIPVIKDPYDIAISDRSFFDREKFVFYTINEWSIRKGMEELIATFLKTFNGRKDVVLHITQSDLDERKQQEWLKNEMAKHSDPPLILYFGSFTDTEIQQLHLDASIRRACYVSLTKGEAIGMGACDAANNGVPVLMTGYGGQLDYLKGVMYIGYHNENPTMCNKLTRFDHKLCKKGNCVQYEWFDNRSQTWGSPNLEEASMMMKFVVDNYEKVRSNTELPRTFLELERNEKSCATEFAEFL